MTEDHTRHAMPRWLVVVLGLAGTVVALAGLRAGAALIAPALLALVLTVVVHPLVTWLQWHRVPRWLAVTAGVLVVDGGLIALVLAVVASLRQLIVLLPTYSAEWTRLLNQVRNGLAAAGFQGEQVQTGLQSAEPGRVGQLLGSLLQGLVGATSGFILVLVTVLFMFADAAYLPGRLAAAAPSSRLGPALASFARRTTSYFVVTTVFGLIVAVLDTLALLALGVPLPLLWGLLSFITNYVPNIGFLIGLLPPALLGLLAGGPKTAILVIVVYSVLNLVIQSILQPVFVGDAVRLSVTVTFLSMILRTWVLGPLGAILSVPLTLLAESVLLQPDHTAGWALALITSAPPPAPGNGGTAGGAGRRTRRRRRRATEVTPPEVTPPDRPTVGAE